LLKHHKYFLHCNECFDNKYSIFNKEKCPVCKKQMVWAGPLWTGKLHDQKMLKAMKKSAEENTKKILEVLLEEDSINTPFFFDVHRISKKMKIKNLPRFERIMEKIRQKKFLASRSQFNKFGIKTNMPIKEFIGYCKKFQES